MQKILNTTIAIIVCVTVMFILTQIQDCNAQTTQQSTIFTPPDSNFYPVVTEKFQEPFISFTDKKSGFTLPANVKNKDVNKVVTLNLKHSSGKPNKIDVIETKDGRVYVAKDSIVDSVTVTEFQPPVASYVGLFGIGVSLGLENPTWAELNNPRLRWSPSLVFAPEEWYGWLHLPIVTLDRYGIGAGAQAKVYHDVFVGVTYNWNFTGGNSIKATTHFMF